MNVSKETKKQASEDERVRNAIEGKFGQVIVKKKLCLAELELPINCDAYGWLRLRDFS